MIYLILKFSMKNKYHEEIVHIKLADFYAKLIALHCIKTHNFSINFF